MSVDGRYELELNTMLGHAAVGLTIKAEGGSLSGDIDGHFGEQSFTGGTIDGNKLVWTMKLESPVGAMDLAVTATVDGESIEGEVKLGSFRPTPFSGRKVR
jgi:hypothetical protein